MARKYLDKVQAKCMLNYEDIPTPEEYEDAIEAEGGEVLGRLQ